MDGYREDKKGETQREKGPDNHDKLIMYEKVVNKWLIINAENKKDAKVQNSPVHHTLFLKSLSAPASISSRAQSA
jgi:hypothetical protein